MTATATLAGGRYRIERTLGRGGMAVVQLARDQELNRPVAIKVLAQHLAEDDAFRRRFLREATLAARLSHPNVVAVYDAGVEDGVPYIVMELVEGETLGDLLARRRRLDAATVADLGAQAAAGLAHAHAHGLVHRDVKPHNLLVRRDGTLKVADFGIARAAAAAERLTLVGSIVGTAAYLSPEQTEGSDAWAAADVYALGVVLYECLTGRTPYAGASLADLLRAQRERVVPPVRELAPETPDALEDVVMRCLARNPVYRPASAAEVARLLSATAEAPTRTLAAPPPPAPRAPRRRPGRLTLALTGLAAALAVAAGALVASRPDAAPPAPPPDRPGQPAVQARELAAWLREVSR